VAGTALSGPVLQNRCHRKSESGAPVGASCDPRESGQGPEVYSLIEWTSRRISDRHKVRRGKCPMNPAKLQDLKLRLVDAHSNVSPSD
jgi:hypothetical protein